MTNLWVDSPRNQDIAQINKVRNERGDIKNWHHRNIQIVREYYEQLYVKKLDNPKEVS